MVSTSTSSTPKLVLVTGANGYIGSVLVKSLLEQGYNVRGTVRDPTNETKTAPLRALPNADKNLQLVAMELTASNPEEFQNAVKDVEWVMHTASPVTLSPKNEDEVVGPAVQGTTSMLNAACNEKSVTKFILTSSMAAIFEGSTLSPNQSYTEDMWSDLDGPNVTPYDKSKTLAERAAWEFMEKQPDAKFTLSVINPPFVLGPVVSPATTSSTEIISRIMKASDPGSIRMYMPLVDVRDVAQAHIQAALVPEAAGKRFILHQSDGGDIFMSDIHVILAKTFNPMGYGVKTWVLPKWMVWLMTWVDKDVAALYPLVDNRTPIDNSRSREILKLNYITAEQTIIDGTHSMIELGMVYKTPGYEAPDKQG